MPWRSFFGECECPAGQFFLVSEWLVGQIVGSENALQVIFVYVNALHVSFLWFRNTLQFSFCGLGMACRSKSGVSEYPTGQSAWSENALQVNFWGLTMLCRVCRASQFVFAVSEAPAGQCSGDHFFGSMNALEINFLGCVNAPQFNFFLGLGMPYRSKWGSRKAVRVKFCGLRMPCKECPTSQFFCGLRMPCNLMFCRSVFGWSMNALQVIFGYVNAPQVNF